MKATQMTAYLQADELRAAELDAVFVGAVLKGARWKPAVIHAWGMARWLDDRVRGDSLLNRFVPILCFFLAFLFCVLPVRQALAQSDEFKIEEISSGNYVHYGSHAERSPQNMGDNANIGFIVGEACVLVFDSGGSIAVGRALRAAIRRVTNRPICYVVISHVHPDHFFGTAAFLDDQPEIIGHQNLPRQLAARSRHYEMTLARDLGDVSQGSKVVMPTKTLPAGTSMTLDLGGREVEIRAWAPAHTDDDLSVFDLSTSTLWLGDLLFVDHTPVLDSNITGFLSVMQELRKLEVRHYVPGHGPSDAQWPAVMDPQQRYFELILTETRQAIRDNVRLMDAVNQVGYSQAQSWVNFETYHRRNVTTAYTELEWE
jgi:quinoprotein relay system zinc metallohydrolase 2